MIIKPRSLTSLSGRPECQGLVYAACPGIDLPYEMFIQQKFTINGTPTLAGASEYGYCYNDNGAARPYLSAAHSLRLNTITDKHTILMVLRPSTISGADYVFTSLYNANSAWSNPFANLSVYRNSAKINMLLTTSATTYQNVAFNGTYFAANTYSTVALTRNGATASGWLNGRFIETVSPASANAIAWGTGMDVIGKGNIGADADHWNGDIVAVYVWNRALSHSEISLISAFPFILFDDGHISNLASFVADAAPLAPTPLSPTSSSDPQADPTPFSWTAPDLATGYRLQVATDAGFTALVHDDATLVTNSASVAGLAAEGAFYWRVLASNLAGSSDWSATETFTRASNLTLIYPGNGMNVANQPVQFAWVA